MRETTVEQRSYTIEDNPTTVTPHTSRRTQRRVQRDKSGKQEVTS
jgi:hypothetical protein